MIIYTAKFSKKKAVAILFAIAIVIAAVILAAPDKDTTEPVFGAGSITSSEDVCQYISSLGYETEGEEMQCRQVLIPESFDEVYENYNAMQKECGFDLSQYKGREATLYTYALADYPGCSDDVLCDVLVYRGNVIGGNIYTLALDGFMHGLKVYEG